MSKEISEMHSKSLVVLELGKSHVQMNQQPFDCFYVTQVLIVKELVKQLFELEDASLSELTLQ